MADGLSIDGGTVTESAPLLDLTQTWNGSGEVFTAIRLSVTNTVSGSASSLIDLQTNGNSKFSVDRAGIVTVAGNLKLAGALVTSAAAAVTLADSGSLVWADPARAGTVGQRISAGVIQYVSGSLFPLGFQFYVANGVGLQVESSGTTTLRSGQKGAVRIVTAPGAVTVASTDFVVVINKSVGAATVVNLPPGETGRLYVIKDGKGDAATNNITITPASGTIDGAATYVMSANYEAVRIVYNDAQWNVI